MKVILLSFLLLLVVAVIVSSDDSFKAFVGDLQESDESVGDEERHDIEKRASKWVRFREKAKKALKEAAEAAAKAKIAGAIAAAVGGGKK